jgi:hypothetical protein
VVRDHRSAGAGRHNYVFGVAKYLEKMAGDIAGFTPVTGRKTLIYSRPKQFVQREIFVLEA